MSYEDGQVLSQLGAGYSPMMTGEPYRPTFGLEGMPFGIGSHNPLLSILLGPMLQQLASRYGVFMPGLGNDQNIYDSMRRQAFTRNMTTSMQDAAKVDQLSYIQTMHGMANIAGVPWGVPQMQHAQSLAGMLTNFTPFLAQMAPDFVDQMGGLRGSNVLLQHQVALANRYRIDPATGLMGISPQQSAVTSSALFRDLYAPNVMQEMQGFGAGRLGGIYTELGRRGMLEGAQVPFRDQVSQAAQEIARLNPGAFGASMTRRMANGGAGLTAEDIDKLQLDPSVAEKLRSVDMDRVKRSLKNYVGVVGAMRDIFGDLGRPNAPMQELFQALEAMSQGGLTQIDPARLNMLVRQTHGLSSLTGVPLDAALTMQQHYAGRAEMFGISPLHAVQALQGNLGWASAYKSSGGASVAAWGRFNADQMTQLEGNLRVAATASTAANRLGGLMRVREAVGGFQEGSNAERLAQAVEAGETSWVDTNNKTRSVMTSGAEFQQIMLGARTTAGRGFGMDYNGLTAILNNRPANEGMINRHDIGGTIRRSQPAEYRERLRTWVAQDLAATLQGAGMSQKAAERAAQRASANIAIRTAGMTDADFADTERRTAVMGDIIQNELKNAGAGGAGYDEKTYRYAADSIYGRWQFAISNDAQLRGFKNPQNMQAVMRPSTLQAGRLVEQQARFNAEMEDMMAPLGRGTVLSRAIQAISTAKPTDGTLNSVIAKTVGVGSDEISDVIVQNFRQVGELQKKLQQQYDALQQTSSPAARTKLLHEIEATKRAFKANMGRVVSDAGTLGISLGDSLLGRNNIATAQESWSTMEGMLGRYATPAAGDAKGWQKFWASDSGKLVSQQARDAVGAAADIAHRYALSPKAITQLGPGGLELYRDMMAKQDQLYSLARDYAGGDVAKLLAGDLTIAKSDPRYKKIDAQIQQAAAAVRSNESQMAATIARGMKNWGTSAAEVTMNAFRSLDFHARDGRDIGELTDDERRQEYNALTEAQKKQLDEARRDIRNMQAGKDGGKTASRMLQQAEEAVKLQTTNLPGLLSRLTKAYGLGDDQAAVGRIASGITSADATGHIRGLVTSTEYLKKFAKGEGSEREVLGRFIAETAEQFAGIEKLKDPNKQKEAYDSFFKEHEIGDNDRSKFMQSIATQRWFGLDQQMRQALPSGSLKSIDAAMDRFRDKSHEDSKGPQKMEIFGTLELISGNKISISATNANTSRK